MSCPAWCREPDCGLAYGAHPWGFSVASAALPTRAHPDTVRINQTEKQWDRDMTAYKALRSDGLQPRRIDGCADVQARAATELEVAYGKPISKKHHSQTADLLAEAAS